MKMTKKTLCSIVLTVAPTVTLAGTKERVDVAITNLPGGSSQGLCSERFSFEIGLGGVDLSDLTVRFDFFDKKGVKFYSATDSVSLDGSEGGHYKEAYVESKELCQEEVAKVSISSAIGKVNGKTVDLVSGRMIHVEKFVPVDVVIPDHK